MAAAFEPVAARRWLRALLLSACVLVAPAMAAPAASYEAALARYQAQDLVGALRLLQDVLVAQPRHAAARLLYARALLDGGNAVAAAKAAREALQLDAPRAEAIPLLARITLLMGDGAQLLSQPEFRDHDLPADARRQVLLLKLEAAIDAHDAAVVRQLLDQAQALGGNDPSAWLAESRWQLRRGDMRAAQAALERAARLAPAHADLAFQRGSLAEAQGAWREALNAYAAALAQDSRHLAARVARARLQLQLGQADAARADVQALRSAAAGDPRTLYLEAMLARQQGHADQARQSLAALTQRIDRLPLPLLRATPQMLLLNGLAHMTLGEPDRARPYLQAHHDLDGGGPSARLLAQCLVSLGEGDRAIEVLRQQLRRQPDDGRSAALLVRTLLADQRVDAALSAAQQAEAQADGVELRVAKALVMVAKGELAAARQALEAALKLQPDHAEARQALAGVLLRSGQPARALPLAQAAAKARPDDAAAQRLLGDAWLAQRQAAAARAAYQQALRLAPQDAAAVLALARLDRREGRLDEAEQALARVVNQAPATAPAAGPASAAAPASAVAATPGADRIRGTLRGPWRAAVQELADLQEKRGRGAQALALYRQLAADAGPGELAPVLLLADFQIRQNQADAALATLRTLPPGEAQVQWLIGRASLLAGDALAARQAYTHAGRLGARDADLQLRIASAQLQLGDAAGAAYSLSRLEGAPAETPAVLTLRVRAEIARPDLPAAQQLVDQVLRRWPRQALGHRLQGELALARRDAAAAVKAMERAMQLQPDTEHLLALFGAVAARDGAAAALPVLESWVRQQPRDWLARNTLSEAYVRLGRYPDAQRSYQAQVALLAPTPAVRHNLAVVMLHNGDAQALDQAEQALQAEPGNPYFLATAGWAALQAGRTEPALARLREARRLLPEHPTVRYYLASALQREGRTAEARAELAPALASERPFEEREAAKRLAAELGR